MSIKIKLRPASLTFSSHVILYPFKSKDKLSLFEYERCYLSTLCRPNLLRVANCDIAIICEHKLKQSSLSYMNSIDTRYHSVSKTDRLNVSVNCTHDKSWIYIVYKSSLQFLDNEIVDTNSERIVGVELKSQNYRSIFRAVLILHSYI